jgi:FtsH-binding integral membrane protein
MAKPLLQLAVLGFAGVALWKIASMVLLPFLMVAFKIALVVGLVMLAIWFFKRNDKPKDDTAEG